MLTAVFAWERIRVVFHSTETYGTRTVGSKRVTKTVCMAKALHAFYTTASRS